MQELAFMFDAIIGEACWELDEGIDDVITNESDVKVGVVAYYSFDG